MRKPIVKGWKEEEIARLKEIADSGASITRCAASLNRSTISIRNQARKLGLVFEGIRKTRSLQRAKIAAAERTLPPGCQRFDGSRT
jgi:hypothetical protein